MQDRLTPSPLLKTMLRSAAKLSLFVGISVLLLLGVRHLTEPPIKEAQKQTMLATFNQVLPPSLYDNDPLKDQLTIRNQHDLQLLGSSEPVIVYRARFQGHASGVIFTCIAPNGYSGKIKLLMGVLPDGRISGVRVLQHAETPGLGDKIELSKHTWILSFNGRSLRDDNLPRWAVKKDGGDFDQFTGATITPRAVVQAVKQGLMFVNQSGEKLYE
ncbi:electron transport complex subunit RsxG [Thiomicrorhabdus sp.]|uniref:electron transport complex subunit RsxG n=1 Tax=Thiomicrorhabdus sp. TaxID=2039724 RepID=UPI0029C851DF|nr:electron transport complex subunit RsxG [Thiomicrorhabdus sp.]